MSRTDVHRPAWVKERDPHERRQFAPSHNHWVREHWDPDQRRWLVRRVAPCDLDVFLAARGPAHTRCRLDYRGGY